MNTYQLTRIVIDTSTGVPLVSFIGKGAASESGAVFPVRKENVPLQGQSLARVNADVADALAYLSNQYGITVTLPPVSVPV